MATPAGGDVSIRMPAAASVLQRRERAAAKMEKRLNRFVRLVAFVEWAGNAFGALAFLWATGVLLGGFCTSLNSQDFWFATVMIFIEAFRIFSRGYRLDNESLFGTTGALKWLSSSFSRMLWRPQEGDEVVLFMGLWINLTDHLSDQRLIGPCAAILEMALLILLSRRPRRPPRWRWPMWALLIACFVDATYQSPKLFTTAEYILKPNMQVHLLAILLGYIATAVAVFLLNFRPRRLTYLTSTPSGRKLVSLAKVVSAVWLASGLVLDILPITVLNSDIGYAFYLFNTPFTIVVLSLGSLQKPADSLFGRWLDAIVHILFLWDLVFPFPAYFFYFLSAHPSQRVRTVLSFILLLLLLLIGNLQIPTAAVQVVLSSWRFQRLLDHHDYSPLPQDGTENMVPSIEVFYVLTICQGSLYIMASILGFFSFFPRRSLVREFKFCGRRGAKAIDVYYQRAYMTCMETGLLASRRTVSLASFTVESLRSMSSRVQLAGVLILDNLLSQETNSSEKLESRIISSEKSVSKLIGMLRWSHVQDRDIRLFAARATTKLAGSIKIAEIPAMLKLVSSLLDAGNQPARHEDSLFHAQVTADRVTAAGLVIAENVVANQSMVQEYVAQPDSRTGENAGSSQPRDGQHRESNKNRGCSWVRRCWQGMKEKWSIPEEPPLTHQDSLPVLGMVILEKLACDLDNCAEMLKATDLISKIIGLISYTTCNKSNNYEGHNAVICSSLHLVRRLAGTDGKNGVTARRKLWESPLLLDNLASILEDNRSSPEVWKPTMGIIAMLALDEDARREIGSTQVIIGKLIHTFLGSNDQSLRIAAGEALTNLTMDNTANCSAILEEPGYELVKDLKDMLCKDEYRIYIYVAARLLQNLCAHSRDKLMSHTGASEHLRSALPAVMENIVSAEGKQLETLIGLASQICSIPECFVFELESQANVAGLVKKLVSTLNSNRKPSPEHPRMRRGTVEMVISLVRSYPGYRTMLIEEGVMEALSKAARTPSKVEKYRVFSGDVGVVAECGIPLRNLVERAKELIGFATPAPGAQPDDHA